MGKSELTRPFPWATYSRKLAARIAVPRWSGTFDPAEAKERRMELITGSDGQISSGNYIELCWLVDPTDGVIADACFQLFGQSALIGAAEAACELVVGKSYARAHAISAEMIDRHLRDRPELPAFPPETYSHLNLVIGALEMAAERCTEIPLADGTLVTPEELVRMGEEGEGGIANWPLLTEKQKLEAIRRVVEEQIQPYIALDAGGVEVLGLINDREVIISYEGACTSCSSSTGSTLAAIQQILRSRIHQSLVVVPNQ
jgi:NifU-like protein